jgi:hypothetical protein
VEKVVDKDKGRIPMKKALISIAVLFALSSFAFSQSIQSVLTRAARQGTAISANYEVPANATGSIMFRSDIPLADLQDPNNSMTVSIELFDPNTGTWHEDCGFVWIGGVKSGKFGWISPRITLTDASEYAGKTVRVSISVPNQMRVGFTVERP